MAEKATVVVKTAVGQEAGAAEARGEWTNRTEMRGEIHISSMPGTAGDKAKLGFDVQGSREPLFQSVDSLWYKLLSISFVIRVGPSVQSKIK